MKHEADASRITAPVAANTQERVKIMLRIGVDIGGTFTDFCGWREGEDQIVTLKVPSTPPSFEKGFRQGFEALQG